MNFLCHSMYGNISCAVEILLGVLWFNSKSIGFFLENMRDVKLYRFFQINFCLLLQKI